MGLNGEGRVEDLKGGMCSMIGTEGVAATGFGATGGGTLGSAGTGLDACSSGTGDFAVWGMGKGLTGVT